MFVRKGTVRKARGGANRRSTRRPRRDSNGAGPSNRKSCIMPDEPSTSSIGGHRLTPNGEPGRAARSASSASLAYMDDVTDTASTHSAHVGNGDRHQLQQHPHQNGTSSNGINREVQQQLHGNYNGHGAYSGNGTYNGNGSYTGNGSMRYQSHVVKPSPARSQATTVVSFDDERRLVRTSIGWDYHPRGDELQPDYGAFMYQIREANKESENIVDFGCKTSNIICNTLLFTILVGMALVLPVAMVSVGVKYLEDCPKEPRIPVYLLVGGCFGMIKLLSSLWRNIQARRYQDIEVVFDDHDIDDAFANTTYRTMDTLLFLFLIGWQIVGSYWTAEIWTPHFKQLLHEPSNWCDRNMYMFTVYQITGCYAAMVLYIIVLTTLTCCVRCNGR